MDNGHVVGDHNVIVNEAGEVAIAYYQPGQAYVDGSRTVTGRGYVFQTQYAHVCMAWVDARDAEVILAITKNCSGCGNKPRRLFAYATPGQVSLWTCGRRGEAGGGDGGGCGC